MIEARYMVQALCWPRLSADSNGRTLSDDTVLNGVGVRSSHHPKKAMRILEREQIARSNKKIFRRAQVYGDVFNALLAGSSGLRRRDENFSPCSAIIQAFSYTK